MRRRRDEELYGAFAEQEDELSLEAILAEYGKGGRQPVPTEEAAIPETPAEEKAPVPVSEAVPPFETEAPSEPAAPEKNEPEYESPAPDRVAMKDIMSQPVDAVLEDEDDGVIAQPVPLRERLAAVLERFHRPAAEQRRRPAFQDTEQLFDEPEEEPEPEEPPEPEPLPEDVLRETYRSVPGLRRCELTRLAYAIEYDCIDSRQLRPTLESLDVRGLFFAGQINGTSGYEEAAVQGSLAGMNAALTAQGKPPIVLTRDQAYIGVLTDDLTTKGTDEPYRMMTSRAEHRLSLRQDNADLRLTRIAYEAGLATRERMERTERKASETAQLLGELRKAKYTPGVTLNDWLEKHHQPEAQNGLSAVELLKRPEITLSALAELSPEIRQFGKPAQEQAEISVKYEGYLERQETLIRHARQMEETLLPEDLPYEEVTGLRIEARQKLMKQRPRSLAAASRIPGVSPADVAVLMVFLEKHKGSA